MIYLDNAATTPISDSALEELVKWNKQYGNSESVYEIGREASQIIEQARDEIAAMIGAKNPKQLIFTSGGCEGNTTAIKSMVLELVKKKQPITIAISGLEHHSVINSVKWAEDYFGVKVVYFPIKNGKINITKVIQDNFFENNKVNIASIIFGNNETGAFLNRLPKLIQNAKQNGVKTHVDAVQIVPHFGLNFLQTITCYPETTADFITFSGHKIGAPKGIGCLFCADFEGLIPLIEGGDQEGGKRGGTLNSGLIASLLVAARNFRYIPYDPPYYTYFQYIYENLIKPEELSLNNEEIFTSFDCLMGIMNIDCKVESAPIVSFLDSCGICVSTGSACNGSTNYSYVLERMGKNPTTAIRVSLSPQTTLEEVKTFVEKMREYFHIIKELGGEN